MMLLKSLGRIANGAQSTLHQIFLSAHPIVHGGGRDRKVFTVKSRRLASVCASLKVTAFGRRPSV